MTRVVGIDAGYINFAVCGVSTNEMARPYYWQNSPLFKGAFSEEKLVAAVHTWINLPAIKELLETADVIVLERQMTMKFQAVNHCVRFNYYAKTIEVNPRTVGAFFGLSVDRPSKKKEAVQLVTRNTAFPVRKGKKDDLADAYLLAAFHAFSSQPSLREVWVDERDPRRELSGPGGSKRKARRVSVKRAASDGDPAAAGHSDERATKRFTIDLVGDPESRADSPA